MSDGTVVMSDRLFAKLLPRNRDSVAKLPIEAIVIKLRSGETVSAVQSALRATLPNTSSVMTKAEIVDFERKFQEELSSAGPIFWLAAIVGFVVGMLISYQVIYTDLSDQLPQYATLKARRSATRPVTPCARCLGRQPCRRLPAMCRLGSSASPPTGLSARSR